MNPTQSSASEPVPPTPKPEAGQGPWCDENLGKWWIVADGPQDALAVIDSLTTNAFPCYFGWTVTVQPCLIQWAHDYNGDEVCVEEVSVYRDEDTITEAWRVTIENR
jgi:hypothetical protein